MTLMNSIPSSSPSRLLIAADRLLKCLQSAAGLNACISMYLFPIGSESSRSSNVFTQAELLDAMDLLRRLDLIPVPVPARRSRRPSK